MKIREVIIPNLFEAAYPGNLGFMELAQFYRVASKEQKAMMEKIVSNHDWEAFKELIFKTLGVKLV